VGSLCGTVPAVADVLLVVVLVVGGVHRATAVCRFPALATYWRTNPRTVWPGVVSAARVTISNFAFNAAGIRTLRCADKSVASRSDFRAIAFLSAGGVVIGAAQLLLAHAHPLGDKFEGEVAGVATLLLGQPDESFFVLDREADAQVIVAAEGSFVLVSGTHSY
jgi:hypothetical protein